MGKTTLYLINVSIAALVAAVSFVSGQRVVRICRDSDIEILSIQGVQIENYPKSRVELHLAERMHHNKPLFFLQFDFKTRARNGVLFYGTTKGKPSEILALFLVDGELRYKMRCPTLEAEVFVSSKKKVPLNDGRWHTVFYSLKFGEHSHKADITIDGHSGSPKQFGVSCSPLSSIIMGGATRDDLINIDELRQIPGHFEGCIRSVNISVPLNIPPKYHAVSICG
ncbi:unnamed protein product [Lymnaea stagnalis]|uniref:Laminin G domain-containing protein n=1 Tax=Lymnaea stagnalis TaxID=6523 RepID=A0AAV2I375_LYMST